LCLAKSLRPRRAIIRLRGEVSSAFLALFQPFEQSMTQIMSRRDCKMMALVPSSNLFARGCAAAEFE
jgi:hypothetical protein